MLKQVETSRAVAETIALCRPQVVCAYPITPQTHIVEGLAELVKAGHLQNCEFINVESEFAALSVAIGASAAGARAYTATASQGPLFMAEAVYNASGLGLPIVMTIGNRAIGAPINIWNDHSDSMAMRDSGWIQLHAETAQEAADLHILAFRIAEQLSCPVMVCIDGFVLTHSYEAVDVPSQKEVDAFLPRFEPRQMLDPADPITIGALVGPEAFTEVRYLQHHNLIRALEVIPELSRSFQHHFGRECGGLLRSYRTADADTVVIALGSVNGTVKDVIDEMREEGSTIGLLTICCYRPFHFCAVRAALGHARRVLVLERSFAPGVGGVVASDVQTAMAGAKVRIMTAIGGLGGRPITKASLRELFDRAERSTLDGGTTDIGLGCLSGMFERNDDVLYICYDNEAYMNTGVQRSSATPAAARTATTPALGKEPGHEFGHGKSVPLIAMAHRIPYVATASIAELRDLEYKVEKAMKIHGARYIHVHVPCPLGWGSEPSDTIRIARLAVETGLFPLFEAQFGTVTERTHIRRLVPVEDYLKLQNRFAHLFSPNADPHAIASIQEIANRNIQEFGLLG